MYRHDKTMRVVSVVVLSMFSGILWAHKPIEADEEPDRFSKAISISDPDVSQVFYDDVEPESPYTWMTFEAGEGDEIYLSLGIPVIERLSDFRPNIALIGPGFPRHNLGFSAPTGTGRVLPSLTEPDTFYEPVTGTNSIILVEATISVPASGRYYLVAFSDEPLPENAKLWVAIGTKERFGLKELFGLGRIRKDVREFHEVD